MIYDSVGILMWQILIISFDKKFYNYEGVCILQAEDIIFVNKRCIISEIYIKDNKNEVI